MSFKETLAADVKGVFLNTDEFADCYTILYGGQTFEAVPAVLTGRLEAERGQLQSDYIQGLYRASHTLYCSVEDLGGIQPRQGGHIEIAGVNETFQAFHVARSQCQSGMLRLELEAVDE